MNDSIDNIEQTGHELAQLKMIEAYFSTRSPLPVNSLISGKPVLPDFKTTQDIVDDIMPMMPVDPALLVKYLNDNNYSTVTDEDGSLKWAIYRDFDMSGVL